MKFLKTISIGALGILTFSCASVKSTGYLLTVPLSEDEDGLKAYIVDYDSGNKIDSAVVENEKAVFKGHIKNPVMAQLVVDGARAGMFILEPGKINADIANRSFNGTPLNDKLIAFGKKAGEYYAGFRKLSADTSATEADKKAIEKEYGDFVKKTIKENNSNPIGYYLFLRDAYEMNLNELDKALAENSAFSNSVRLKRLRDNLIKKEETSVGKKFKDFTITQPNGTKASLSQYVGKGKYTLVDFWASWCGPCIRETAVIKGIYNEYKDKGLDVLGVAVWDEPQNTLAAVEKHALPWPQIINAQSIPTDLYGISGIPCIILFDPEGNIVSRDKQDQDLKNDVRKAMETLIENTAVSED